MGEENRKDPDAGKVVALYVASIATIAFQFVPLPSLQMMSIVMMIVILAAIRFLRRSAAKDSLMHNHATYLSRTISIWSLLLLVSLVAAGLYIRQLYDFEQLLAMVESFSRGRIETPEARHLAMIGVIAIMPSTLYLLYRLAKGFQRAVNGYRLAKPKGLL